MAIKDALLPEFDHETGATRRLIERIPDGDLAWRPHEKSMTLGRLANHLAQLTALVDRVVEAEELDLQRTGYTPPTFTSTAERLAAFEAGAARMRAQLEGLAWETALKPWRMTFGERVLIDAPRAEVIRRMGLSHMAHHRAQLGVYLRLLDVPVPGVYGPSADEA